MSQYIPFTEEEKLRAGSADIAELLRDRGEEVRRSGKELVWIRDGEKISIRGNLWFNQYRREGGNSIDFARKFLNLGYPDAVKLLLGERRESAAQSPSSGGNVGSTTQKKQAQKPFTPPKKHHDMKRVFSYLIKTRGIDPDIVLSFARMGLIYEEAGYHNAVFCGKDENGVMRHANKRGTLRNSTFKGNQAGSLPQYSFHYSGSSDTIYFFEAPIDMLSYISLQKENWRVHSYAAACSVSDQVLLHQLKLHANLKKCVLCLDNDLAGYRAGERICEKLLENGYEVEVDYPRKKDWNEELLQRQEQEKECALCPAMRY